MKISSVDSELKSSFGVRQGSCEGLRQISLYNAGSVRNNEMTKTGILYSWERIYHRRTYRTDTKNNQIRTKLLTVRWWHGTNFFSSKGDLEYGASCLYEHLLKYGLTMYIGTGAMPSATEAMYFPPPRRLYSDANTSRLDVFDYLGNSVSFQSILRWYSSTLVRSSINLWPQMQTLVSALGRHRSLLESI
jgi:hypothetical protein